MAQYNRTHEARIAALEAMLHSENPVSVSSREAVSLKEHFDTRLKAIEKSTDLSANTLEKRLEGMNEFRDTLRDQASRFVTRDELEVRTSVNRDAIAELRTFKDRLEGKASASSVYIAYGISLVGLVLSIIGILMK